MIRFNRPIHLDSAKKYMSDVILSNQLCGDGKYTKHCHEWIQNKFNCNKALLTTSGTSALEMAALLLDIQPGDEIIMPSYTFVSTANAFVLRGANIRFVDIRPDTMNIDENHIEQAISNKTKAIVPVHYAGVSCEMDIINSIAKEYGLYVVEDAAQAFMAKYKGKYCGNLSDIGCFSFHETKNYTMGEGGAICMNFPKWIERAEIIREKGTNRSKFFRGEIDKYTWIDQGSSYLPSEFNAAYLYAQLEIAEEINKNRMVSWEYYNSELMDLRNSEHIETLIVPEGIEHNAHMFWMKVKDLKERQKLLKYLYENGVHAVFHYVPLHSSKAGLQFGKMVGTDTYTTAESERIFRLPLYYDMDKKELDYVIEILHSYFRRGDK